MKNFLKVLGIILIVTGSYINAGGALASKYNEGGAVGLILSGVVFIVLGFAIFIINNKSKI